MMCWNAGSTAVCNSLVICCCYRERFAREIWSFLSRSCNWQKWKLSCSGFHFQTGRHISRCWTSARLLFRGLLIWMKLILISRIMRNFQISGLLGRLFDRVDLIKPVSNVCPSVRPYVRTSVRPSVHTKFLRFQWNLACRQRSTSDARRYAVWPDPRSRSRSRTLENWKSGSFQKLYFPPFTMGADNWPRSLKLRHNRLRKFDVAGFLIFGLVFVSRDFEVWSWHRFQLWRVDRQSPYGANFLELFVVTTVTVSYGKVLLCITVTV